MYIYEFIIRSKLPYELSSEADYYYEYGTLSVSNSCELTGKLMRLCSQERIADSYLPLTISFMKVA